MDPSPNPNPNPNPSPDQVLSVALGDSIYLWNASDGSIQQLMQASQPWAEPWVKPWAEPWAEPRP